MLRLTMLLLCLILAGAAAGRYKAEAAVRETRHEIRKLDQVKAEEASKIQVLRAEVAYLESPERLASIAGSATNLEPLSGAQLMTADEFVAAFGGAHDAFADAVPPAPIVEVAQAGEPTLR